MPIPHSREKHKSLLVLCNLLSPGSNYLNYFVAYISKHRPLYAKYSNSDFEALYAIGPRVNYDNIVNQTSGAKVQVRTLSCLLAVLE